jgi:formylglycine-generating enzyme required for sulfatase activity
MPAETPDAQSPLDTPVSHPQPDDDNVGATWDPSRGDDFFDDDALNVDAPPRRNTPETGNDDPGATYDPSGAANIEDVWGTDLDDITPSMTLKSPQDAKLQAPPQQQPSGTAHDIPAPEGYDLLDVLGEGGVGIVYQAHQKSIDRRIAVKMIKPQVGQDAEERAKFVTEAIVTGRLDHPNIVPIHDLGQTADGQPFYAMKMVRGTPWSRTLRTATLSENLRILLDVCDAVAFAHSKGVIHRDLKPENVMLGEFGEVQVMDWGLGAVLHDEDGALRVSESQAAGGTPAYMAPEMVTGEDAPVGVQSDVYLLGAMLYEVITHRPPHAGARVMDCLQNALANVIEPPEQEGVLVDIAMRAMRTDPAERYASAREFRQALLDYQANAESIRLCERSSQDLERARHERDYEAFAEALFGFRQALELWEGNTDAAVGVRETQRHYAQCAFEKGDYDLAASTLDPDCPDHRALADEIAQAHQRREAARRRLRVFKLTAIGLTLAVIVILTVASIWIAAARRQAIVAKEAAIDAKEQAVTAREAETEQRELAETARARAQAEEARAVKAHHELEQAVQAMVAAQTKEEQARAKARAADLVATKTRDELAKTGMLLDNDWWTFDAAAGRAKQQQAAADIGHPVEWTLTLADDTPLTLVLIPPGEFVMGSPPKEERRAADEYLHRVSHPHAFYLGKFELTETQWQTLVGTPPPSAAERDADATLPAAGMSVDDVLNTLIPALQAYAPPGYVFRLPTEAEWEYACRAGCASAYHVTEQNGGLDAAGWYLSNSDRKVQPIGNKQPNAFGLFDLHGNVSELCADNHRVGYYLESPVDSPRADGDGERLVVRGGSVLNTPEHCRAAYRSYIYRKNHYEFVGLRLALVPANP